MKGISAAILIVLILLFTVSIAALSYEIAVSMVTITTQKTGEQTQFIIQRLLPTLVIETITNDKIYVRNIGTQKFNGSLSIYINGSMSCEKETGTENQYSNVIFLEIEPKSVASIEVGCCINRGISEVRINSGTQTIVSRVNTFDNSQELFRDWERIAGDDDSSCFCLDFGACNPSYRCTLNNIAGLEQRIQSISDLGGWYLEPPPYTWNISKVGGNLCCRCGWCFTMLARSKFFYNPNNFQDKDIWLVGDSPECQKSGVNGIYINDNMYVMLNNHILFWNGTSYGAVNTGQMEESKQWCIPPVDLSGSTFSQDCEWNNVTVGFEDYCQVSVDEAGGIYGMYLQAV